MPFVASYTMFHFRHYLIQCFVGLVIKSFPKKVVKAEDNRVTRPRHLQKL